MIIKLCTTRSLTVNNGCIQRIFGGINIGIRFAGLDLRFSGATLDVITMGIGAGEVGAGKLLVEGDRAVWEIGGHTPRDLIVYRHGVLAAATMSVVFIMLICKLMAVI